ncbi:SH3 domain-containing protein [Pseudomonas sp. GM30]|uniref:SH3 domain-containing protein n=1 Tax=Pseudomonas sp. GM30 TaxID=1144328 RepID=UPI001EE65898|nr:SH3 domain-containing protein [Pseudomonas sp. GM30]
MNVRDQTDGKIISKLTRGAKVQVYQRRDDWVRISIDGQAAKWLSSKSLCSDLNCSPTSQAPPSIFQLRPVRRQAPGIRFLLSLLFRTRLHRAKRGALLHNIGW